MKLHKSVFVILTLAFVLSVWGPAPVAAKNSMEVGTSSVGQTSSLTVSPVIDSKVKMAKLSVNNKTGGYLSIRLWGANGSYYFSIAPGKHRVELKPGRYSYTVSAVCGSKSGGVTIKKGRSWKWWCVKRK